MRRRRRYTTSVQCSGVSIMAQTAGSPRAHEPARCGSARNWREGGRGSSSNAHGAWAPKYKPDIAALSPSMPQDDDDDDDDGFILAVGESVGDTFAASPRVPPTAEWVAMVMMETNDHFTAFRTNHPAAAVPRVSLSFNHEHRGRHGPDEFEASHARACIVHIVLSMGLDQYPNGFEVRHVRPRVARS